MWSKDETIQYVEKHTENKCPNRAVVCPNGCVASMKPTTIKDHTESECPLSVVNYEFAYAGCLQMMWRIDVKDHLESAIQEHIILLSEKVKEMDSEIQRLKAENVAKDLRISMLIDPQGQNLATKLTTRTQSLKKLFVMCLPSKADDNLVKSVFGQFSWVGNVKLLRGGGMAIVDYAKSASCSHSCSEEILFYVLVLLPVERNWMYVLNSSWDINIVSLYVRSCNYYDVCIFCNT